MNKVALNLIEKLEILQTEFKAPKSEYNSHGGFKYRTLEKMLEAFKPLAVNHRVNLRFSDRLENCADTPHIVADAILTDLDDIKSVIIVSASAQEASIQKGMQSAQISGSTSSYARKYALSALLLVDDTDEIDKKEGDQTDWEREINTSKDVNQLMKIFNKMNPQQKTQYTDLLSVRKTELLEAVKNATT